MNLMNLKSAKNDIRDKNVDVLLWDVEQMIYKLANQASVRYELPYDECLGECYWAFVRAVNFRYDPSRGSSFSTFLYKLISFRFRSMFRHKVKDSMRLPTVPLTEEIVQSVEETGVTEIPSLQIMDTLSADGKLLLSLLVNTPAELLEGTPTPKQVLRRIQRHLRSKNGWTRKSFKITQQELKEKLQAFWQEL